MARNKFIHFTGGIKLYAMYPMYASAIQRGPWQKASAINYVNSSRTGYIKIEALQMAAPMRRGKFRRRRSENLEKPKFLAIQFHFFCVSCFEVSFTLLNWLIGPWGAFPPPCLALFFVVLLVWSVACNMREAKPQQIKSVSPLARKCLLQIHSFICIAEFGLNVIWYTADNGRGPQLWSMEHWQSRGDPAPNGTHSTRGNRSLIWLRRMAYGEWRMQMGFVTNDMQFSNTSDAQTHTHTH